MIEISHLVKRYGAKFAVDDISFSVGKGEIVGFLGPNGAGKSTTMNILTGYLSSTSGTATVGGIDILENPYEAKKLIGFLPEQPPLYVDMKVDEYLNFIYELKKCKLNREKHLAEVCEVTKISDVRGRMIKNLSKGYKQRVGIAQALIGNPKVLIFDEPTVGLDPKQIIEIRNLIRNLGTDHTIILSTHILPEVQAVCDRIVIINQGRLIADEKTENITRVVEENRLYSVKVCGPQREVLSVLSKVPGVVRADAVGERELDSFTYHIESEPGVDVRKPLFFALSEHNWPIIGLEAVGMSLEDVFMKLMDADAKKKQRASQNRAGARDNR
ncbi:MAG: ATP-binding cassette domain-containing protein [Ruminococcaceae bacterium]|nr:ATP-binding cassette domain-containing protein [Oscillospiraceae bacterium]